MQSTKETLSGHAGLEEIMQTSLWGIARKAKENKKYKFGNLYGLINEIALHKAWKKLNKSASAGIDKITAKEFKTNLEENIREIVQDLKNKKYKAKLVRRVYIPKSNNELRPLGIPTLRDKLVQRAVADILEAIYEQDFIENSYGYRPGRNAHMAIDALRKEVWQKYNYIVEADIKGFFNNINHDWMIKMLEERIKDKAFLNLIKKWLKAGILDTTGEVINPINGCPQGSIVSPVLANIYLHYVLDKWFEVVVKKQSKSKAYLCRLADDFICAFRYKEDAERFYNTLGKRLNKFGLELASNKTRMIKFSRFEKTSDAKFTFLGFEFRWKVSRNGNDYISRTTDKKKLNKSLKEFTKWCKENRNNRIGKIIDIVNLKLRGYFNYYGVAGNSVRTSFFYHHATKILYKWLNRRSQRKSFNYEDFNKKMKYYGLIIPPKVTENPYMQMSIDDLSFA